MFGINAGEFLVLVGVALLVLGPERLPDHAAQLGRLVRQARTFAFRARDQVRDELGPEFDDVDWQALDPRRYDPRRIVREALFDGDDDPLGLSAFNAGTGRPPGRPGGAPDRSGSGVVSGAAAAVPGLADRSDPIAAVTSSDHAGQVSGTDEQPTGPQTSGGYDVDAT